MNSISSGQKLWLKKKKKDQLAHQQISIQVSKEDFVENGNIGDVYEVAWSKMAMIEVT